MQQIARKADIPARVRRSSGERSEQQGVPNRCSPKKSPACPASNAVKRRGRSEFSGPTLPGPRLPKRCPSCGLRVQRLGRQHVEHGGARPLPSTSWETQKKRRAPAFLRERVGTGESQLVAVNPVQDIDLVETVGEVGAAAERVQAEGRHCNDQVGARPAQEHWPAGVARAGAAAPVAVALCL